MTELYDCIPYFNSVTSKVRVSVINLNRNNKVPDSWGVCQDVRPKYGQFLVDADDCLDKVVVVDAADKVRQEVLSDVIVHTGEEELEQVQHTGTEVCPAKVLEDQVRTEISGLQLGLVAVLEVFSQEVAVTQHLEVFQILTPHTHSISHSSHEHI